MTVIPMNPNMDNSRSKIRYIPKSELDEYLIDEINVRIKMYKSKNYQIDVGLEYFNKLYYDLYFFINYKDDYKAISLHFKQKPENLDCLDALIYYQITKEGITLGPIAEMSLNYIIQRVGETVRIPFLWGSQKQRIQNSTDQLGELLKLDDTKFKLTKLIKYKAKLQSMGVMESFNETKEFLIIQYNAEIEKLEKLLNLGLLPDEVAFSDKDTFSAKPSKYALSPKKKTDFIKIISAMYDANIFVKQNGSATTNKQDLMEAFGSLLNEDFSKYSSSLAQAKNGDEKIYIKTFETLTEKAWDYLNAVKD